MSVKENISKVSLLLRHLYIHMLVNYIHDKYYSDRNLLLKVQVVYPNDSIPLLWELNKLWQELFYSVF